jgi:Ca2+-binding RTX toxin-like protein
MDGAVEVDVKIEQAESFTSGLDTISGFERAVGTKRADARFGDKSADVLFGGGSRDFVVGRAGDDRMVGASGTT